MYTFFFPVIWPERKDHITWCHKYLFLRLKKDVMRCDHFHVFWERKMRNMRMISAREKGQKRKVGKGGFVRGGFGWHGVKGGFQSWTLVRVLCGNGIPLPPFNLDLTFSLPQCYLILTSFLPLLLPWLNLCLVENLQPRFGTTIYRTMGSGTKNRFLGCTGVSPCKKGQGAVQVGGGAVRALRHINSPGKSTIWTNAGQDSNF